MSTINQELLRLLKDKLDTGITQVYWQVSLKRQATGLPRDQAAIAVAMELDIDISKYATEYDLTEIRKVEPGLKALINKMLPEKSQVAQGVKRAQEEEPNPDPYLDNKMITAAHRNAEICSKFFLFENSLRRVVSAVMEEEFGIDWWYDNAPHDIMYNTFDRRSGEQGPKWRGQFGAEPIYYTDINDLKEIIDKNKKIFHKYLGNNTNIENWIEIIERVRAALSYANPVTLKDREKFFDYVTQWTKLSNQVHKKINSH